MVLPKEGQKLWAKPQVKRDSTRQPRICTFTSIYFLASILFARSFQLAKCPVSHHLPDCFRWPNVWVVVCFRWFIAHLGAFLISVMPFVISKWFATFGTKCTPVAYYCYTHRRRQWAFKKIIQLHYDAALTTSQPHSTFYSSLLSLTIEFKIANASKSQGRSFGPHHAKKRSRGKGGDVLQIAQRAAHEGRLSMFSPFCSRWVA